MPGFFSPRPFSPFGATRGRSIAKFEARSIRRGSEPVNHCDHRFYNGNGDRERAGGRAATGGDLDEAPQAYRRLPEVLAAHAGTIRVLHTLTPIGVVMAGRDIFDPYKD